MIAVKDIVASGPAEELELGPLVESITSLGVVAGASNLVALECAGTATGTLRLTLWLGRSGPVATYESSAGPATFDRAAAYAEAAGPAFSQQVARHLVS